MNAAEETTASSAYKKWVAPIVIILLLIVGYAAGLHEHFTLSNLIKHRASLAGFVSENIIVAMISYVLLYITIVAVSFPGASALTITSGLLFGGILAGFLTVVGATIGAVIIFLIARSSLGDFLESKAGPFVNKMIAGFQKDQFQYLLTLRLTPVFPFWVVNIVPALLKMRVFPYALATFIGIIPGTFAFAYIGAGMDSIIAAQEEANPGCADAGTCSIEIGALITTDLLIALAGLAALSALPFIVKKLRGGKAVADGNANS